MAYYYDNLKLDKGMYREAGRSFSQVLEREDPSERYKGTSLEGLDAFQRQLKRFDIKVKGRPATRWRPSSAPPTPQCSSPSTSPAPSARGWRRGYPPHITAAVTKIDGMDYRSISSEAGGEEKSSSP